MSAALSLVIPGCCGPLSAKTAAYKYLDPALHQLPFWKQLSRGVRSAAAENFHQQLTALFNLDNRNGVFPFAALDLLGEGGVPEDKLWCHADPVCMQADMDHAILFDAASLQLADHEAEQLLAELNAHFLQDGIELQGGTASSWYLQLSQTHNFSTSALHEVVGRNVNHFMPSGADAAVWKRFMNEAQMLLHMSPVNQQREARGQLPVNSLWLWGEGCLPVAPVTTSTHDLVIANNACARGLAQHLGMACEVMPPDVAGLNTYLASDKKLCVVLDDLFSVTSVGDVAVWQQQLIALYETWLQPLIDIAMRDNIEVQLYSCNGSAYRLRASDRFRFWRSGSLKDHLRLDA